MYKSARTRKNETLNSTPGFNPDITYEHSSRVKSCCWQGKWFMSLDQQTLQLWGRDFMYSDKIEVHQKQTFPENKSHFVSAVTHATPMGPAAPVILAACLDHTLKVYSEKLRLRSSISWDAGTVTMMVYNTKRDTLIAAGSAGVKLWASTADTDAYAREKSLPATDRPWFDVNGCIVPWCYGRFQAAKEQLTFEVPGLKTKITAADVAVPSAGNVSWCNVVQLLTPQQLLLVMFQADVFGFNAGDGSRLYSWRGLSEQPLVDMVYLSAHQQLVTASRESTVVVRQLQQDGSLAWVRTLGRFAAGVHCVAAAAGRPWLLTASLDGFVVAWSTENWQQLFRMKLPEAVAGIQFYKADNFFCLSGSQVKFFKLRQAAECWMELSSPLTSLEPLSYDLLLATFADSSIRLLDAGSTAADKAALTTVPQLSSASLLASAADLPGGRLFALLSNGHVHVWDLHMTRPPALLEVWTHLQQEKCCSLAFMDGASVDPVIAKTLGLSLKSHTPVNPEALTASGGTDAAAGQAQQESGTADSAASSSTCLFVQRLCNTAVNAGVEDHVFIGTRKGEVLVCDAARQGLLILRVPAIKLLPVSVLLLDLDLSRMVVGGGRVVKVWDLERLICIAEFEGRSEFLCGHILGGRLLLGSACGRCYMLDLSTGKPVAPPAAAAAGGSAVQPCPAAAASSSDHDGPVMCVSGNCYLQHYVTASQDGYVKVFDRDRRLKASLYLASPLTAAAFLNDSGDILVAPAGAKHLMVVLAATYAVTPRTRRNDPDVSIFDDLKGRGTATPRTLMRNMTCNLQALATMQGPVPLSRDGPPACNMACRYPSPLAISSIPSTPSAAATSSNAKPQITAAGFSPLNPATLLAPWGLPSPSSTLKPETSLQQPAVIQSSSRPPVDLDQNRVRAETARSMAPARVPHRLSTIGRAVQQQQQQQQQDGGKEHGIPWDAGCGQEAESSMPAAAAASAAAIGGAIGGGSSGVVLRPVANCRHSGQSMSAGEAAAGSRIGRMARGAMQQQQQQQQQQHSILPLLKQLPAAFAGLTVSTDASQQMLQQQKQQQQQLVMSAAGASPLSLLATVSAAAAAAAGDNAADALSAVGSLTSAYLSSQLTSDALNAAAAAAAARAAAVVVKAGADAYNSNNNSRRGRQAASSSSRSSSSRSGRWNTTVEYNLKALEIEHWKKSLKKAHGSSDAVNTDNDEYGSDEPTSGSSSSSDAEEDSSGHEDCDGGSGSSGGSDSGSDDPTAQSPAAAAAAAGSLHQRLLLPRVGNASASGAAAAAAAAGPGDLFSVGQLKIRVPRAPATSSMGTQQQQQGAAAVAGQGSDGSSGLGIHTSSSSSKSVLCKQLDGLQGSLRHTVAVVEDPDVFMDDVPVPCELQELLDKYYAEMAAGPVKKVKKKRKKKMEKKQAQQQENGGAKIVTASGAADLAGCVIAAGAYGCWKGAQGVVGDPTAAAAAATAAAAGLQKKTKKKSDNDMLTGQGSKGSKGSKCSSSSKSNTQQKDKKLTYTSALDYLMHTVTDPAVLVELKEAESHDSRQASLARQWLAVGSSRQSRAMNAAASVSRKGGPIISSSGNVERLLDSLSRTAQQQQGQQQQ